MHMLSPPPNLGRLKAGQDAAWPAGDDATVGATLQMVGEALCEAIDLRSTERVLDVGAGTGSAALAAARRFAAVTSINGVPALLEQGRARTVAEGLAVEFRTADAEALPFADGTFDVVLSTFGVMFTPDQGRAAAELRRVCALGGRIGLANWTPDGFAGQLFTLLSRDVLQPPGARHPALWGTVDRLRHLFPGVVSIVALPRTFTFRYRSAAHWLDVFRACHGPVRKAFQALDPGRQAALEAEVLALLARFDQGGGDGLVVRSEYLEVRIHT